MNENEIIKNLVALSPIYRAVEVTFRFLKTSKILILGFLNVFFCFLKIVIIFSITLSHIKLKLQKLELENLNHIELIIFNFNDFVYSIDL